MSASDSPGEIERALADPQLRARLARALSDELKSGNKAVRQWRPFLAGVVSGLVAVLAFLLPSLQEQWTLYQTHSAVDRYTEIGRSLMEQGNYQPAEQAFSRALELAGGQRIDLLQEQLRAHVQRMNDDPAWPGAVPDDVTEGDFVYLLELQDAPGEEHDRAATLAAYGAFLAGNKRWTDAEARLHEAIEFDADNIAAHINLGNLMDDRNQPQSAEKEYREALRLEPEESNAHYDLALLLQETGRNAEAVTELQSYIKLEPDEAEAHTQLATSLRALGKSAEATEQEKIAKALKKPAERAKAVKPATE